MSVHVSTLIWQIPMPMPTKLVMLKLADNANEEGTNVRPSQNTVANQCGCSVRTVQRVVKWAEDCGFIVCESAPEGRVKTYRFDMDLLRHSCVNPRQRVRGDRESGVTESQGNPCQRVTTPLSESHPINKNRQGTVNKPSERDAPKGFVKPTVEECREYAVKIGIPSIEGETFHDFHTAKGWKIGKEPMKDWNAALRTWRRRYNQHSEHKEPAPRKRFSGVEEKAS